MEYRTDFEERIPKVKIIGIEVQVVEEVVGICLRDIGAIQIQAEEHEESPYHDPKVDLPNNFLLRGDNQSPITEDDGEYPTNSSRQVQRAFGSNR